MHENSQLKTRPQLRVAQEATPATATLTMHTSQGAVRVAHGDLGYQPVKGMSSENSLALIILL